MSAGCRRGPVSQEISNLARWKARTGCPRGTACGRSRRLVPRGSAPWRCGAAEERATIEPGLWKGESKAASRQERRGREGRQAKGKS